VRNWADCPRLAFTKLSSQLGGRTHCGGRECLSNSVLELRVAKTCGQGIPVAFERDQWRLSRKPARYNFSGCPSPLHMSYCHEETGLSYPKTRERWAEYLEVDTTWLPFGHSYCALQNSCESLAPKNTINLHRVHLPAHHHAAALTPATSRAE
jgi:hypothetical protein